MKMRIKIDHADLKRLAACHINVQLGLGPYDKKAIHADEVLFVLNDAEDGELSATIEVER